MDSESLAEALVAGEEPYRDEYKFFREIWLEIFPHRMIAGEALVNMARNAELTQISLKRRLSAEETDELREVEFPTIYTTEAQLDRHFGKVSKTR